MKEFGFLVLLIAFNSAFSLPNYYPQDYQDKLENSSIKNEQLKLAIRDLLINKHQTHKDSPDTLVSSCKSATSCYGHNVLGYKTARKYMFGDLYLNKHDDGEYSVKDVYCNKEFIDSDFKRTNALGSMKIPNANILNCEHTWPQSKFSGRYSNTMQKSDLHHLFPTASKANSMRGNYPFAEVKGGKIPFGGCSSSRSGKSVSTPASSSSRITFEPPNNHKGNVARALFYFSVRYELKISASEEYFLRQWAIDDPVDREEQRINSRIHEVQGTRNPFIDIPNLFEQIQNF